MPTPTYTLVVAIEGTGAYGYGKFKNSLPNDYSHTGIAVNMLLSSAGQSLDWINVMAYNFGNAYNSSEAFDSFNSLLPGKVVMGVVVPPEAYGPHALTIDELNRLANYVLNSTVQGAGMMLWNLAKIPINGQESDANPGPQRIVTAICNKFALGQCSKPLF